MALNLMIMKADEVVRWYTPANEAEAYIHGLLADALQKLEATEEEQNEELNNKDDEITKLAAEVAAAEEKIDGLEDELFEERERIAELTKELDAIRDSATV